MQATATVAGAVPARPARRARPWSLRPASYRLAAAPFLFLLLLFVVPLARVVVQGFGHDAAGPGNFTRIATSGPYVSVLIGTVQTALVVTGVCLLLGYPLAYAGARLRGRWQTLFTGLILVPLFTSVLVRSYAWMIVFGRSGPLNQVLTWLDWPGAPVRLLQTPFAVDVGMVHILLPFMVLPVLGAMRAIDGSLLGGGRSTTVAVLIEQQAVDLLNWPMASALATVLLALSVAVYVGYNRLTRRFNEVRA